MIDDDIREMSSRFEAVKIAMTQDKNGHVLKLSIHPNDTPEDVMRDVVGTRYMVVIVRMDDQGQPVASQTTEEGNKAIKLAGALCRDEKFQLFMAINNYADEPTEESVTEGLRSYLGVESRKELRTDSEARRRLLALRDEFTAELRQKGATYAR